MPKAPDCSVTLADVTIRDVTKYESVYLKLQPDWEEGEDGPPMIVTRPGAAVEPATRDELKAAAARGAREHAPARCWPGEVARWPVDAATDLLSAGVYVQVYATAAAPTDDAADDAADDGSDASSSGAAVAAADALLGEGYLTLLPCARAPNARRREGVALRVAGGSKCGVLALETLALRTLPLDAIRERRIAE